LSIQELHINAQVGDAMALVSTIAGEAYLSYLDVTGLFKEHRAFGAKFVFALK
jgi:hypothetical protein